MIKYIVFFIIVIALFVLVMKLKNSSLFGIKKYKKQKYLLTKSEYAFYKALFPIIQKYSLVICPKVRLGDVVMTTTKSSDNNFRRDFGLIAQKHLDFVICNRALMPLFAIELDDRSHDRNENVRRDIVKNNVCKDAGFILVRYKTRNSYLPEEIEMFLLKNGLITTSENESDKRFFYN